MAQALAIKYRPKTFDDVTEQTSVKVILQQQIKSGELQHAYLFVGSAGCGKTTCARILANEINKGEGNPIELDAASNNGVDDVRNIIQQAQTKSLDSEYKIFIIDECHALSNSAWQAMLKLIEEPPAKSIFIFCTTNPEKIPKTILSRVQRYDFKRISQKGIVHRLDYILASEVEEGNIPTGDHQDLEAVEYIAKIADGGMRDAITLMDKCLAYSIDITLENVVKVLGTTDYDTMFKLTDLLLGIGKDAQRQSIELIENLYNEGKDLKQFVHGYCNFLLDLCKLNIGCGWNLIAIPRLKEYENFVDDLDEGNYELISVWMERFLRLDTNIKYSATPKLDIECTLYNLLEVGV